MGNSFLEKLRMTIGDQYVIDKEEIVGRLSKDYYWYSPILEKELENKKADYIVSPTTEEDLIKVLQVAVQERVPVTIRGGGTGNYGQAVPLTGGLLIDMSQLNKVIEIGDDYARVQAGVRLKDLEKNLHSANRELTIYPSTYAKATIGGFVSGGSGGIGSVTWGNLWDGNVHSAKIITTEDPIKVIDVCGDELMNYIHSYGTTGIMTEVTVPIKHKSDWMQKIYGFRSLNDALQFSQEIAEGGEWKKRLVSVVEAPISKFFIPLKRHLSDSNLNLVLIEIDEGMELSLNQEAVKYNGAILYSRTAEMYRQGIGISDFTWNHTTLWAIKYDNNWTYLQNLFLKNELYWQVDQIKKEFGDEVLLHFEWIRSKGELKPSALPLVKFQSKERIYEIIDFFGSIGVSTNNPHTYLLGAGGWNMQLEAIAKRKKVNDPYNLLNQGKLPNEKLIREFTNQ